VIKGSYECRTEAIHMWQARRTLRSERLPTKEDTPRHRGTPDIPADETKTTAIGAHKKMHGVAEL